MSTLQVGIVVAKNVLSRVRLMSQEVNRPGFG